MTLAFKSDSYADAQAVRRAVFMDEQGFQNEFDEVDERPSTIHVTAYDQAGALVGCARVFPDDGADTNRHGPGAWIFGRLAVMPEARGSGAGSLILAESERLAMPSAACSRSTSGPATSPTETSSSTSTSSTSGWASSCKGNGRGCCDCAPAWLLRLLWPPLA